MSNPNEQPTFTILQSNPQEFVVQIRAPMVATVMPFQAILLIFTLFFMIDMIRDFTLTLSNTKLIFASLWLLLFPAFCMLMALSFAWQLFGFQTIWMTHTQLQSTCRIGFFSRTRSFDFNGDARFKTQSYRLTGFNDSKIPFPSFWGIGSGPIVCTFAKHGWFEFAAALDAETACQLCERLNTWRSQSNPQLESYS